MSTSQTAYEERLSKLSNRRLQILAALPAYCGELAEQFDISRSRVRGYITDINAVLDGLVDNDDGLYHLTGHQYLSDSAAEACPVPAPSPPAEDMDLSLDGDNESVSADTPEDEPVDKPLIDSVNRMSYVPSEAKSVVTSDYKKYAAEMERHVNEVLNETEPAIADDEAYRLAEAEAQDVLVHRSDDHIGQLVTDEHGNEIFNPSVAREAVWQVAEETVNSIGHFAGGNVGCVHIALGGDTVTGETIYNGQQFDVCLTLTEQVQLAVQLYFRFIRALSHRYPRVQVACQRGNHGEIRTGGSSNEANADTLVYKWLDAMVRLAQHYGDLENVTFMHSTANKYVNFKARGHKVHLRHGQDSLEHIGTSAGKKRWLTWMARSGFDLGLRGHYHEFKVEHIMDNPVLMSGSICPPDDFEDSIAEYSQPTATIVGMSDESPVEWIRPVRV